MIVIGPDVALELLAVRDYYEQERECGAFCSRFSDVPVRIRLHDAPEPRPVRARDRAAPARTALLGGKVAFGSSLALSSLAEKLPRYRSPSSPPHAETCQSSEKIMHVAVSFAPASPQ